MGPKLPVTTLVNTRAVADTGAHTDIISLETLKSLGYDPNTLIKMKVRVDSITKGLQR